MIVKILAEELWREELAYDVNPDSITDEDVKARIIELNSRSVHTTAELYELRELCAEWGDQLPTYLADARATYLLAKLQSDDITYHDKEISTFRYVRLRPTVSMMTELSAGPIDEFAGFMGDFSALRPDITRIKAMAYIKNGIACFIPEEDYKYANIEKDENGDLVITLNEDVFANAVDLGQDIMPAFYTLVNAREHDKRYKFGSYKPSTGDISVRIK